MPIARDRALVLRRFPFGESSLVAHVLTREHGRVHLIAKGAYRPTSRYFAVLDYFATLELEWDDNPRRELATLRAGDVSVTRRALTRDLAAYHSAMTMLELAELVSQPGAREPRLFDLLEEALGELARGTPPFDAALAVFEARLLAELGLAPALASCAACGRAPDPGRGAEPRVTFSAAAGGRLCVPCAVEARASGRRVGTLPRQVLEDCLRLVQGRPLDERAARTRASGERTVTERPVNERIVNERPVDERTVNERTVNERIVNERIGRVRDFLERFVEYHLETRPRTHRRSSKGHGARAS